MIDFILIRESIFLYDIFVGQYAPRVERKNETEKEKRKKMIKKKEREGKENSRGGRKHNVSNLGRTVMQKLWGKNCVKHKMQVSFFIPNLL